MNEEAFFTKLFEGAAPPLPQQPFVRGVMRRARRRLWARRIVLSVAVLISVAISLESLAELLGVTGQALVVLSQNWNNATWLAEYWAPLVLVTVLFGWPAVLRWLAR
jgi:hypothetical protein